MTSGALRTIRSSLARASAADSAGAALPLPLPPERIRSVAPRRLRLPPVGGRQASIRLGSGRTPPSSSLISRLPLGHVTLERPATLAPLIGPPLPEGSNPRSPTRQLYQRIHQG